MDMSDMPPTDCVLVCEDKAEVPCHAVVLLISGSPVLAAMKDTKAREDGIKAIPFKGSSVTAGKLLHWLYSIGDIELSIPEAVDLARVGHFLDISRLAVKCEEVLLDKVGEAFSEQKFPGAAEPINKYCNVIPWMEFADSYSLSNFGNTCQEYIVKHKDAVCQDSRMGRLEGSRLAKILWQVVTLDE